MNWISKLQKLGENIKRNIKKKWPTKAEQESSKFVPLNCCNTGPIERSQLEENLFVCPKCSFHHTIDVRTRFDMHFGKNNWQEIKAPLTTDDPLNFKDQKPYKDRLKEARKKTNQDSAVLSCITKINGIEIVVSGLNFAFMGGSIAQNETENILYAIQTAIDKKCSYLVCTASGGMRMQEGILSLHSMTRMTIAVNQLKKNNLPFLVLYCAPATAGGTTASITSLSDIAMAERRVTIAFSGKRVIQGVVNEKLDERIQRADWVLEKGFLDLEVERKDVSNKIYSILSILLKKDQLSQKNKDEASGDIVKTKEAS